MALRSDRLDAIVNLSKRRGFVYPSSEIYGGLRAAWDYGPLGVEMKNNVKRQWWRTMVQEREDIVGIDSSVILAREVWEASGHVTNFVDPLTECQACHKRFRADHLIEAYEEKHGHPPENGLHSIACPNCGTRGAFTEPRMFNGLLRTYLGATEDESGLAYLRPETAQGIFINFKNVLTTSRRKVPFGIGQIGKSFRNEITPGNFIFRTREFEQMEMEFFVKPGSDEEWHEYWLDPRLAPVKVAVLPLSRNADLSPKARDIAAVLRKRWNTDFDDASAIGRRYRRQDEIGTPYCVTVDFDSLEDQAVTVRERDSMAQVRIGIDALPDYLADRLPAS